MHTHKHKTAHHSVIPVKTWYPGLVGVACYPFMVSGALFCFFAHTKTNCSSLCHYIQDLVSRACWFGMSSLHVSGVLFCFPMHAQTQTRHHSVISFKPWYPGLVGLACHCFMFQVFCLFFFNAHKQKLFITLSFHSRPGIQGLLVWHVIPSCFRWPVFWHTPKHKLFITLSFLIHTYMHAYIHTYRQTCIHT